MLAGPKGTRAVLIPARRSAVITSGMLAAAGAFPPAAFAGLPQAFAALGPLPVGVVLVGAMTVLPAACGLAAALIGMDRLAASFRARADMEHEQVVLRILCLGAMLAYALALAALYPSDRAVATSLLIASVTLAGSWLFLLHLMISPAPSAVRRGAGMLADLGALSAFMHAGGALGAPWFSAYLLIAFYNGFRFGQRALLAAALVGLAAFAATATITPFWREQPWISAGVLLALIILPAYGAIFVRALAAHQTRVAEADAAKTRFLAVLGRELSQPLKEIIERSGRSGEAAEPRLALPVRALLSRVEDILDFSRIESGNFAPETRAFDLHRVLNDVLALLRGQAAFKGLTLSLRMDPNLPYRLRGWPHQLGQILNILVTHAIKTTETGKVRVSVDEATRDDQLVRVRIAVRDDGLSATPEQRDAMFDPFAPTEENAFPANGELGVAIAKRLVELMGGRIAAEDAPGRGKVFTLVLPFTIDHSAPTAALDLGHRPVWIVTEDAQFASELAEPLNAWHADVRWMGLTDSALADIERLANPEVQRVLIVDGRHEVLQALTFCHRAVCAGEQPPLVLFVAEPLWIDRLIELADGELSGLLPAPLTDRVLGNALHALPLGTSETPGTESPALPASIPADQAPAAPESQGERVRNPVPADGRNIEIQSRATVSGSAPASRSSSATNTHSLDSSRRARTILPKRRLRVLAADDDLATRELIATLVGGQGHQVQCAATGEEALHALESMEFDVALMGIAMAELSGYEAARLYRMSHFEGPRLPIIALTDEAGAENERLCREAGMDAVLTKPIDPQELTAAIEDAVAVVGELAARSAERASIVTPIAAHPRFAADNTLPPVDERTVEALRSLGGGSDFFRDVLDSFRVDSRQILQRISRAAASADVRAFKEGAHALRSCAAHVGGSRLCESLLGLREVTARELRQQGTAHVQRLTGELARLDAALAEFLGETEDQEVERRP